MMMVESREIPTTVVAVVVKPIGDERLISTTGRASAVSLLRCKMVPGWL
jgi:hypothetical protein